MKIKIEKAKTNSKQFNDLMPLEVFEYKGHLHIKTEYLSIETSDEECYEYNALCLENGDIKSFSGYEGVVPKDAILQVEE